ncbi:hypothetical protein Tco_1116311, partial [Tanacetum coccineum]
MSAADVAATWASGTQLAYVALPRRLTWDSHADVAADVDTIRKFIEKHLQAGLVGLYTEGYEELLSSGLLLRGSKTWDQVSILAKEKGFGQEMHQSEEPKALYGVTSPKDYAVTYSIEEMSHHTLYNVKFLQDYTATFKYTRDDVSDSALRRNICDRGNVGSQRKYNHSIGNEIV